MQMREFKYLKLGDKLRRFCAEKKANKRQMGAADMGLQTCYTGIVPKWDRVKDMPFLE